MTEKLHAVRPVIAPIVDEPTAHPAKRPDRCSLCRKKDAEIERLRGQLEEGYEMALANVEELQRKLSHAVQRDAGQYELRSTHGRGNRYTRPDPTT